MAITSDGNLLAGSSKSAGSSLVVTTGITIAADKVVVLCIAKDNVQTTDGQTDEVTSVTDSQSNAYTKIGEFTNGQGGAASGCTVAAYLSKLTTQLGSSDTITVNFSSSITAKALQGCSFSVGAGNSLQLAAGSLQTLASDAANPPSMSIAGLSSKEYLFFRCIAHENNGGSIVNTASYSSPSTTISSTTGGQAATNMGAISEFRILTGTGSSSDPNITTQDQAAIYFALEEVAGAQNLAPSLFTNTATFFSPTVTPGSVGLTPSLFTNTNTFFSPTVANIQTLVPSLFTNSQTFFSPTVTRGTVTLTPSLFTNGQSFFTPTVTTGAVSLAPSLFTNSQTFHSPTVTGTYSLTPALFTNSQTFFSPVVSQAGGVQNLLPDLTVNSNVFFSPTVSTSNGMFPSLVTNVSVFFEATVEAIAPERIENLEFALGRPLLKRRIRKFKW